MLLELGNEEAACIWDAGMVKFLLSSCLVSLHVISITVSALVLPLSVRIRRSVGTDLKYKNMESY